MFSGHQSISQWNHETLSGHPCKTLPFPYFQNRFVSKLFTTYVVGTFGWCSKLYFIWLRVTSYKTISFNKRTDDSNSVTVDVKYIYISRVFASSHLSASSCRHPQTHVTMICWPNANIHVMLRRYTCDDADGGVASASRSMRIGVFGIYVWVMFTIATERALLVSQRFRPVDVYAKANALHMH